MFLMNAIKLSYTFAGYIYFKIVHFVELHHALCDSIQDKDKQKPVKGRMEIFGIMLISIQCDKCSRLVPSFVMDNL